MRRNFRFSLCIFKIIILLVAIFTISGLAVADTAPKFALLNGKGDLVKLSGLIQKNNIIIAFWASYCAPCKREIPQLVDLENKYGKTKNLKLVLINIDKEGKEKGVPFLKDINLSSGECLFDIYQLTIKKYVPSMKLPATYLVNKKGDMLFKAIGETQENINNLEKAIQGMQ